MIWLKYYDVSLLTDLVYTNHEALVFFTTIISTKYAISQLGMGVG
jgi:hypothetical protein